MGSKYTLRPLRREDKELPPVVEVAYPALSQKAPDGEGRLLTGHLPQFVAVSSLSSCACCPLWRPSEPSVPPLFDLFFLDRIPTLLVHGAVFLVFDRPCCNVMVCSAHNLLTRVRTGFACRQQASFSTRFSWRGWGCQLPVKVKAGSHYSSGKQFSCPTILQLSDFP